jgi:CheY-like chemotaxis protein
LDILIADDDRNFGLILQRELEEESHTVDWVTDGVEAVLRCLERSYGLVLMDIRMPRLSGLDALRIITRLNPLIPVVTISGNAGAHEMEECARLGARTCLAKPFSFVQLKDDIARLVAADRATFPQPEEGRTP